MEYTLTYWRPSRDKEKTKTTLSNITEANLVESLNYLFSLGVLTVRIKQVSSASGAARLLGKKGGKASMAKRTLEERKEMGYKLAEKRWGYKRDE
jgi:hypothetical protein